ncbi:MAG: orotidine-5'-phosphate decarboxylase [Elusimicrobia bacterium]|nr:orotidine-5'-phosphate decarboxylase [Elusimicrobiota bacterium]
MKINAKDRLIIALDVSSWEEARSLVKKLKGVVSFFKIGIILHLMTGIDFIKEIIASGNKVFLDLKYFDVEDTIREAVENVSKMGVTFLTLHGTGKIIKAAVEGRGKSGLKLLAVTVLTSLEAQDIKDLGFECSVEDLVLFRAKKAAAAGCDGVIASGREAELIREKIGNKLLVVSPGIRRKTDTVDDHKRPATPTNAILGGADYLVVGRPIIKDKDPRQAAADIIKEMEIAFQKREKDS